MKMRITPLYAILVSLFLFLNTSCFGSKTTEHSNQNLFGDASLPEDSFETQEKASSNTAPSEDLAVLQVAPAAPVAKRGSGGGGAGRLYLGGKMEEEKSQVDAVDFNTAEFKDLDPNRFMTVATSPMSTFGADVDTASYSIFRRFINDGRAPRNRSLRTEEMINYFHYDLSEPKAGQPFSVLTEITPCPWREDTKLLRIALATHKIAPADYPPSNLVFLLDVSGSMSSPDKLPLLQQAILMLVEQMKPNDRISIVTYASSQELLLDGATYNDRVKIEKAVQSLLAGGSTYGDKGIQMAYAVAEKNFIEGGNNRIILGTDGDLNVGVTSENELKALVEDKRKSGVFLSVMGFGMDNLKDNKLETLANNGNGTYYFIDTVAQARKVLVEDLPQTLYVAAKDVKFQVEFNPAKIKGYRLLGYETRALKTEDFADDTKDAGEVGAGHQVTVLYEIVTVDSPYPIPSVDTKYQKTVPVESNDLFTLNIRYKEPTGEESKLLSYPVDQRAERSSMSDDMTFASAVAQVNMIVNNSTFVGSATLDSVLAQLERAPNAVNNDDRKEFVQLVQSLKGLE